MLEMNTETDNSIYGTDQKVDNGGCSTCRPHNGKENYEQIIATAASSPMAEPEPIPLPECGLIDCHTNTAMDCHSHDSDQSDHNKLIMPSRNAARHPNCICQDIGQHIPDGYAFAIDTKSAAIDTKAAGSIKNKQYVGGTKPNFSNQLHLNNIPISQLCGGCQKILQKDRCSESTCAEGSVHVRLADKTLQMHKINPVNYMCICHSFCNKCNLPLILSPSAFAGNCNIPVCSNLTNTHHLLYYAPDNKCSCLSNTEEGATIRGKSMTSPRNPEACTSNSSEALFCRICHEGDSYETLFSPCKCTGTMGLLHMTCLQTWFESTNTSKCEICDFEYFIEREPKTIVEWLSHPESVGERRNLLCDVVCFLILTPLAAVSSWLCLLGANHYSKWRERWEVPGLIALTAFLLSIFFIWCTLALKYHLHMWYDWRKRNQVIRIHEVHKTNPLKAKPKRRRPRVSHDSENFVDTAGTFRPLNVHQQLRGSTPSNDIPLRKFVAGDNSLSAVKKDANHNSFFDTIPVFSINSHFLIPPSTNHKLTGSKNINLCACYKGDKIASPTETTALNISAAQCKSVSNDLTSSVVSSDGSVPHVNRDSHPVPVIPGSHSPHVMPGSHSPRVIRGSHSPHVIHDAHSRQHDECHMIDMDQCGFDNDLPTSAVSTPLRGAHCVTLPEYAPLDQTAILSFTSDGSDSLLINRVQETSM